MRELTARAPLHDGVVGSLRPTGPDQPHWSRWEKSTTTFGPPGRLAMTAVLLGSVALAALWGAFLYVLMFPVVAAVALPAIWARGWVVPGEVELPPLPVVERPAPPVTPARRAVRITGLASIVLGVGLLAQGPPTAKAAVLAVGAIAGPVWCWRRFLTS